MYPSGSHAEVCGAAVVSMWVVVLLEEGMQLAEAAGSQGAMTPGSSPPPAPRPSSTPGSLSDQEAARRLPGWPGVGAGTAT
jgi:hypothetical protein